MTLLLTKASSSAKCVLVALLCLFMTSCAILGRERVVQECKYQFIDNPRGTRADRLGETNQSECHDIHANIVESGEFSHFYEFVKLIQVRYPPTLTLLVKSKTQISPSPVLIKTGGHQERVYRSVDQTVSYGGGEQRFIFGRFAAEATYGIREEFWPYRLVLSVESGAR